MTNSQWSQLTVHYLSSEERSNVEEHYQASADD